MVFSKVGKLKFADQGAYFMIGSHVRTNTSEVGPKEKSRHSEVGPDVKSALLIS